MATDYRGESVNPTFATKEQLDYARQMARYLQSKDNKFHMTPGMAVLPGSWMHGIGPNFIDQLASSDYSQIAGQGDLQIRSQAQGLPSPATRPTVGDSISNIGKNLWSKVSSLGKGAVSPGADAKDLTTGSIGREGETVEPTAPKVNYADEVKKLENGDLFSGKTKESKAQWDFQQHTNGFGTKAKNEGEIINTDEAHRRFGDSWTKAENQVDQFKPGLPAGPRAALTSLTFNSGTKWMDSGLGVAVQSDDAEKAKELFTQYNKVKDKSGEYYTHAGLKERRAKEANWFDDVTPTMGGMPQAPNDKLTGQMNLGGPPEPSPEGGGPGAAMQLGGPVPPADAITTGAMGAIPPTGPKLAQAFGTQGPANNLPPSSNPNPPLLKPKTPSQLDAQVRSVPLDEIGKVIEGHRQELKGEDIKNPFGVTRAIPDPTGQGNNKYNNMPNQAPMITVGNMTVPAIPDGKGGYKLSIPGLGDRTVTSLEDLNKIGAELEASKTRITGRSSIMTEHYAKQENEITQRARGAAVNQQMLGLAKQMSNDPNFYSGTGAERVLDYKKIASYLSGNPNWSGSTEAFGKLLARANIEGLEAFKGYGQIRNPEIDLLKESSGTLTNSPGAIQAIIDMNDRASARLIEIGDKMREYRNKHGTLDEGFDTEMAKFYKDRPLYSDEEIKNYKDLFKMEKNKGGTPWTDLGKGVRRQKIE